MASKERAKVLREYLDKWDFQVFPLMPIAEEDAEYLLHVIEIYEREKNYHRDYQNERRKSQAFIRGVKNEM